MNDPRSGIRICIPRWRFAGALCALLALTACGGGGVGGGSAAATPAPPSTPPQTPPTIDAADAARLLDQATFGVRASDLAHVQSIGINAYINEQMAYPPTQYTGYAYTPHTAPAVIGDAVKGGAIYGTMPTLELSGPDDASNLGRWIPTIAVDQFAATLATWFGADEAALAAVLPNLGAFTPSTLGFI